LTGVVLFFCSTFCLTGASSIDWAAGSPVPNPGGQALTIEGLDSYRQRRK
jgi:hypothetical protein